MRRAEMGRRVESEQPRFSLSRPEHRHAGVVDHAENAQQCFVGQSERCARDDCNWSRGRENGNSLFVVI